MPSVFASRYLFSMRKNLSNLINSMFRLQNYVTKRLIKDDVDNSVPITFRSTRKNDLLKVSSDFLFSNYINSDNIISLFPDMEKISKWYIDIPHTDYSNQSFYSGTNTSNLLVCTSDPYDLIAVIAKTEGGKMKGFETLQVLLEENTFNNNHPLFPYSLLTSNKVDNYTFYRLKGIPADQFGMSFDCTECRIPIGLFSVIRVVH